MTDAHTPGPWIWRAGSLVQEPTAPRARTVFIIEYLPYEGLYLDDEGPNARLIAAAPDLLEAAKSGFLALVGLKMALAVEQNGWEWPDDAPDRVPIAAERIRAAILKATTPNAGERG